MDYQISINSREYLAKLERLEPSKSTYGLVVYKARLSVVVMDEGEHVKTDVWDAEVWKDSRHQFVFDLLKNGQENLEARPFDTAEVRRKNKDDLSPSCGGIEPEMFGLLFGTWAAKIAPGYAKARSRSAKSSTAN